ncbi:MAG: MotA/TolQ/ExbB proton channel family protein [Puniceicoccaceae bacterium]|nr:MAG: MotA/TolQ/ExbB proton channel family protein [Puniceicoccaceae bacterium]
MNFAELFATVIDIWVKGGWLMIPLALLALFIYLSGFELIFYFRRYGYDRSDKNVWGHWVDRPDEGEGQLGHLIRFSQMGGRRLENVRSRIHELRFTHIEPAQRRILCLSILVTAAPLTGLLGTVIGMIVTFAGLSSSSGSAIDIVAGGISQALITTQTGLIIAIPGYVIVHYARRRCVQLEGFFAELEVQSMKKIQHAKPLSA